MCGHEGDGTACNDGNEYDLNTHDCPAGDDICLKVWLRRSVAMEVQVPLAVDICDDEDGCANEGDDTDCDVDNTTFINDYDSLTCEYYNVCDCAHD